MGENIIYHIGEWIKNHSDVDIDPSNSTEVIIYVFSLVSLFVLIRLAAINAKSKKENEDKI